MQLISKLKCFYINHILPKLVPASVRKFHMDAMSRALSISSKNRTLMRRVEELHEICRDNDRQIDALHEENSGLRAAIASLSAGYDSLASALIALGGNPNAVNPVQIREGIR